MHDHIRRLNAVSLALLVIPYLLYVGFVVWIDQGPVDYETFMDIGHRLIAGEEVYGENSYYPMPFVMLFALFDWLPRPVSISLWLLAPMLSALWISGGNPLVLLFAPLFGHVVGGQTAVFGMVGLWGYRRNIEPGSMVGGFFLGLLMIKPQLGIIPLAYAFVQWGKYAHDLKRVPRQAVAWTLTVLLIFAPGFLLMPDWPLRWLSHPRPLFERAMAGFVPRTLLYVVPTHTSAYWLILIAVGGLLLYGVWRINNRVVALDLVVLWGFIVNPLVHDYDLIQLIPLLEKRALQVGAVLLSIPGWAVILCAYSNDSAWYVFTIIAPGLLGIWLYQRRRLQPNIPA